MYKFTYVDNILLFLCMLFFKSTTIGFTIRYELRYLKPKHFYVKNRSKNIIKQYFYINFKSYLNPLLYYTNIVYPLIAILSLIIATINLFYSCYYLVQFINTIACTLTIFVFLLRIFFHFFHKHKKMMRYK